MIMRHRALFGLTLVGVWGLSTLSGVADDADRCVNATGREGITACDRVIASGEIGRRGRAVAYYYRGLAKLGMGEYDRAIADLMPRSASIRRAPGHSTTAPPPGMSKVIGIVRWPILASFAPAACRGRRTDFASLAILGITA
jgi:hypothetical protein